MKLVGWESKVAHVVAAGEQRGEGQRLSPEQPAGATWQTWNFVFNLRSIERHCRALSIGTGYPGLGFYYVPSGYCWSVDFRVRWKLGSQGGGVAVTGMRDDGGLESGW